MNNIYLASGLGADARVFDYLEFPADSRIFHIKWIKHQPDESLSDYAFRLSGQVRTRANNIIIGVSFGGIIAIELSQYTRFDRIIIISSVKNSGEIPLYYKFIGRLKFIYLIPAALLNRYTPVVSYLFGTRNERERELLKNIIEDTDPHFAKWAISRLPSWNYTEENPGIIHIHGTADRIIPYRYVRQALPVDGGGHFMIVSEAERISGMIRDAL